MCTMLSIGPVWPAAVDSYTRRTLHPYFSSVGVSEQEGRTEMLKVVLAVLVDVTTRSIAPRAYR